MGRNRSKYMLDVIYPYKHVESQELEYSVKSLKNIKHKNVYVIGDSHNKVPVVTPASQFWSKFSTAHDQIAKYYHVKELETSDKLLLMNDDFFILGKWTPENYNRGTLKDHISQRRTYDYYTKQLKSTENYLLSKGMTTVDYELHTPFLVERDKLIQAIEELIPALKMRRVILLRSYYGNRFNIESTYREDVKNPGSLEGMTLVSTSEKTFKDNIDYIKSVL